MDEPARRSRLLRSKRRRGNVRVGRRNSQQENHSYEIQHASGILQSRPTEEAGKPKTAPIALGKRALDTLDNVQQSSITATDPTPFPFMRLPAELRLAIYRKAFVRDKPILLRSATASTEENDSDESESRSIERISDHEQTNAQKYVLRTSDSPIRLAHDGGRKRRKVVRSSFRPSEDSLVPQLLAVCQTLYHEARPVLYSENAFELELSTATATLMSLPQPSRSLIKRVNLSVPTHHDIIEGFTDLVRLGLRYCWGLEKLSLTLPPFSPSAKHTNTSPTNVYANSFQILRWLPQKTAVVLKGGRTEDIDKVIEENQRMASSLDKAAYFKRQHQMPERPNTD